MGRDSFVANRLPLCLVGALLAEYCSYMLFVLDVLQGTRDLAGSCCLVKAAAVGG